MDFIDDKGRLFGKVNIIDALAVLLVLGVVAAGAAFALGTDEQPVNQSASTDQLRNSTTTVTVQVPGVQPYVADAIPEGEVGKNRINAVENKSIEPTVVIVRNQNSSFRERAHPRKKTVMVQTTLNTTVRVESGEILFGGKPLEIGRQLVLDFGHVTVKGSVTEIRAAN
ncbi:DUF4330 domain-containing protein [Halorussus sp. AFM4]|uniref:DUF4330 domain-containing protein n=1 Tax=Halorussus sp. AFM4 TaxID=3421651 RepID=UPI003EBE26D3